jgi:hypothetical protein
VPAKLVLFLLPARQSEKGGADTERAREEIIRDRSLPPERTKIPLFSKGILYIEK